MNKVLCLAGMHRSGTSLTASWLENCGLRIHNGNVIEASTGNDKGHFEDKDFVDLHSLVIKRLEPKSLGWKIDVDHFLNFKNNQLVKAKKLVDIRNEQYLVWGWKDPRTTLFLEQWQEIIPNLKVVIVWRPCSEVVLSLVERSQKALNPILKIKIIEAVKLWNTYNQRLCDYKQKNPKNTLVFKLNDIIDRNELVLEEINKKLNLDLNYYPIKNIYSEQMLKKRNYLLDNFAKKSAIHIAKFYYKSAQIEEKLQSVSEIFLEKSV